MLDRRLEYVVATARAGSFTVAANQVGVTQSAITKSVADLERELGYLIFLRTPRGVQITEEGRQFVDRAAQLLDDARNLLRGELLGITPFADTLRIVICPASLEQQLVKPLALLLKEHPEIRLELMGAKFDRAIEQLHNGGADVAVGFSAAFRDQSELELSNFDAAPTTMFVCRNHPLASLTDLTLADYARFPLVMPSDSRPYGADFRYIYESQGILAGRMIHIVDHFPIARMIVLNSTAIGVVSINYASSSHFKQSFVTIPFPTRRPNPQLCCATRARSRVKRVVEAFIACCVSARCDEGQLLRVR